MKAVSSMQILQGETITVLYGGTSSEREISLISGKAVIAALQELGAQVQVIDVTASFLTTQLPEIQGESVFIVLHGGHGENGTIQAALELAGLSFTGSGMAASAIAMSKLRTKQVWLATGISTPLYVLLQADTSWDEVSAALGRKVIVKPACEGSSIGMSIASDENSFEKARALAFRYDSSVIAEQWIDGEEYTVAILGARALPVIRLKTDKAFYDFEAKYQSSTTQYLCPCGLDATEEQAMQQLALRAFHAIGGEGWGRIDVMRNRAGENFLLEVNTVPGMTDHSLVPMAAKVDGLDFNSLVLAILDSKRRPL
jgi:D-alanine-D-alanine ligase